MTRLRLLFLLMLIAATARADVTLDSIAPELSIKGSLRTRAEAWNWFEPKSGINNDYVFGATLGRLAVQWKAWRYEVVAEGQTSALFGLPDDAVGAPPEGPLGLGGVYFAHNRAQDDASVFLKQGYVLLKDVAQDIGFTGLNLKGGRFEFSEGSEVPAGGEPTLEWLKKARIGERLIGPFGWSHVGRAYDGGTASWTTNPEWCTATWWPTCTANVTLFGAHPTQGGFDLDGNDEIDEITVGYAAFNLTRPRFSTNTDARLFYMYYDDGRGLLKSDNRPLPAREADLGTDITIHSFGGNVQQVIPTGAGPFDLLAWGLVQTGDWGPLDHGAHGYDFEAGWQPASVAWKPWLRVGYGRTSGDDDPADGDHGTFFQMLPTARIYSWSTFYNLQNNEDAFVQLILRPTQALVWRTDFHAIRVSEEKDLWYQGSGATLADRNVGFGFPGRPAGGRNELLRIIETQLTYDWSPNISAGIYYGHVFGGGVVRSLFAEDDADFALLELTLKI